MPVTLTLNLLQLQTKAEVGFAAAVHGYADKANAAFEDESWQWAGTTRRKNGEVAGSPRNLVDTGELRDSQQEPQITGLTARITWDAPYAAAVFLGATDRKRAYSLPGRNLPQQVADKFNFAEVFIRYFEL
ncbi:hypothetical protein GCM10022631_29590 [Deinococcus rubellus]|uniref:HK97 gp10 family phage protein n=1 Tax=Deinococcus rubellus TaxID=1889240 RepID=A0ABY5YHA9_9DEIO|nr:hypothetical protein [Deinococcus rubellus]UWX64195.1 hypothetical protein N0D28_00500 [Deinococcus rubellus]